MVSMAARGQLARIEVKGDTLTVVTTGEESFKSRKEEGASLVEILQNAGVDPVSNQVEVVVKGSSGLSSLFGILINFLPLIFFGAILFGGMGAAVGGIGSCI